MAKLSGPAAPLLAVAALTLIALLMLSAAYVAARLGRDGVDCSTQIKSLIKPMFNAFETTGMPAKDCISSEKELFERLQGEGANTPGDIFMTVRKRHD